MVVLQRTEEAMAVQEVAAGMQHAKALVGGKGKEDVVAGPVNVIARRVGRSLGGICR
jgi:hypothetical protein